MSTHVLDAGRIVETVGRLRDRIAERFPASGLAAVADDLADTARLTAARVAILGRPDYGLRLLALIAVVAGVAAQIYVAHVVDWVAVVRRADVVGISQGLDAIVNLLLLAFAAIWFVLTLEQRFKRRGALRRLYELRSFAHVIDMHQLTKDPTIVLAGGAPTPSSPQRPMSEFELSRYLDYCAEMLALVAKLAALYAGQIQDGAVISAVNEIEALTSDLGRKIWQKIMILGRLDERRSVPAP
ncbi:MAG TPA: hypothetical protein VNU97_12690 [Rhizomicrobium sp.]|jgi:hypothetical protein|nr:hypothetical protein [Rhizomicrobium sp.]